ncbi:unnamed protein product, partial [marine sediment metagenome]
VRQKSNHVLRRRRRRVPPGRSAGSVFKNPSGGPAHRLIREAGCAGLEQGGAVVSRAHTNFILNHNGASAADIRFLLETVKKRVRETSGIELEPEIRLVGEFS